MENSYNDAGVPQEVGDQGVNVYELLSLTLAQTSLKVPLL